MFAQSRELRRGREARLSGDPQLIEQLKRTLFVKVYVDGNILGSDSATMSFTPHIWYVFDTGKVFEQKLDSWPVRLVKSPGPASINVGQEPEPKWDYPLERLTISKALLFRLIRSHLVEATVEAEIFCTLTSYFGEAEERDQRSALYAWTLKAYSSRIRTVGADALPISVFTRRDDCLSAENDGKIFMTELLRPTETHLAIGLKLYELGEDGKSLDFYGRPAWLSKPHRAHFPGPFNSFGETTTSRSCEPGDDQHDFCELRFLLIEELNRLIYDE